jgi:NhaP-type Na+/H+ or K+/H+ antiporter
MKIPYNPLLLLSGIILGAYHMNLGIVGQATHLMSQADPNGILAIFLPCLIFESAFKTEWHTFKKMAGQSLIMGVLSSLVGASLIAIILKLLIDHENVYF